MKFSRTLQVFTVSAPGHVLNVYRMERAEPVVFNVHLTATATTEPCWHAKDNSPADIFADGLSHLIEVSADRNWTANTLEECKREFAEWVNK